MKGLIEIYNIGASEIICKEIKMKSYFKITFRIKVNYEWLLERKLNEKWY